MMNNEIYILTIDSIDPNGFNIKKTRVFKNIEDARKVFNKEREYFEDTNAEDGITGKGDDYFCWYEDGYYLSNHFELNIEKGVLE